MVARLKHVAIISDNYALLGRFYEALFGMKSFAGSRPDSAVAVTDGYVGLNVNPRAPGRQAGFDHFGFEVDDAEAIFDRVREAYPTVRYLKRPSNRPFAGISMHDPAGNVFDLSQRGMTNRADVYAATEGTTERTPRHLRHITLRTVDPVSVARFYRDVFDLAEQPKAADDQSHYLSDGVVTLVVAPWNITDFLGSGIERPALDHLGFHVESLEGFQADVEALTRRNPALAPGPLGVGPESEVRKGLLATCRFGQSQLADPDGVLIDVSAD
jgi:predicted enzyme related to lactoylglutathione lyase